MNRSGKGAGLVNKERCMMGQILYIHFGLALMPVVR